MKCCRLPVAVVCLLVVFFTAGWVTSAAQAAVLNQAHPDAAKTRVGIKPLEPFVFIGEDGRPSGFSIDLWNAIAAELGLQYEWVPAATVNELITDLQTERTDLAIVGISMTPEREALVDFTYLYFESGLQIMVQETPDAGSVSLSNILFSSIIFKMLDMGLVLLFIMANLIWLMEKHSNPGISKTYAAGVWDGLWWGLKMLLKQEIRHTTTDTIHEAYAVLLNGEGDAIFFDAPVLLFYSQNQGYGLVRVAGPIFQEENYGIALPTGSPLREPNNAALLRLQSSGRYDKIYEKWFGPTQ